VFRSQLCNCAVELDAALSVIETGGSGIVLSLPNAGLDAHDVSAVTARDDYHIVAQILRDFGVVSVRLLGAGPLLTATLETYGVVVTREDRHGPAAISRSLRE
jgi:GTP cyclohydrolase II